MKRMCFSSLAALLCVGALVRADQPVGQFATFNDWLGAEAKGVRIAADGHLRLSPHLRKVAGLPEGVIWCAIPDGSGGAILSAGTEGKLFRYTGGQVKPFTTVKGGVVFAMARMGQDVLVCPSGEGKVFRISPAGDVRPFADIDARLVWAMHVQGAEVVLAGAGEKGAVLVLAREGSSRKLAELPEETSFTALLPDGPSAFYLGTYGKGLVVRYTGAAAGDRLETLMSTGFEEVRSMVLHEGALYLGANNGLTNRIATGNLERREAYGAEASGTSRCAVIRLDKDRVPETLWQSAQAQVFGLTAWNGSLLIGTGNRSRIFSVPLSARDRKEDPFTAMQDLGVGQATAFLGTGSDLLVVGSNPAELHVMSEAQATEGTLDSKPLRGLPVAQWGRAYLDAEIPSGTGVELQFRAGNTEQPDGTWTVWTPPLRSGERPNLPITRFAQFRLKLTSARGGATPEVAGLRVHWANRNLSPMWEGVEVMPPGVVITRQAPPDDIGIERVPLETQKLIPALGYAGAEKRSYRRASQAFVFKASDPNGDTLSFRLRLLPERGQPIELEKTWKEKFFTFDTLPVPDGKYRLEVTASDAPSQPLNEVLTSTWRTQPFWIDHTPPIISEFTAVHEGEAVRVRFVGRDELSTLKEAFVSADGDAWVPVGPEDRIFDAKEERFEVLLPKDRVKGDRITVRVVDAAGNEQSAVVLMEDGTRKKR